MFAIAFSKIVIGSSLVLSLTILNASNDNNYIENYLNDFYQKLDNELLIETSFCNDLLNDINNITCNEKKTANIALLDFTTYQRAGGNNSFLNNKQSFLMIGMLILMVL